MRNLARYVGYVLKWGTLLSTGGFAACVLLQIFARLLLPAAPSWTEEAARLFFVLAVGFSAGLALRSGAYVSFDFFYRRLSARWQRHLSFGIGVMTVILFGLFTFYAIEFTLMGRAESSPSLQFPMAVPFASTVILGGSIWFYAARRLPPR